MDRGNKCRDDNCEFSPAVEVQSGLASGDRVVTRGGFSLKPGDRVVVDGEGV